MLNLCSILLTAAAANQAPADVAEQFDRWERRLRARIERLHVVPADAHRVAPCDVIVRFAVDRQGRPQAAQIRESSCSHYYERRALALVREVGRVGPVPSNAADDHYVVLKLSYGAAPDAIADRRLTERLRAERRAQASRNLAIVATTADRSAASGWQATER